MLKSVFRYLTQREEFESVLSAVILQESWFLTVASCLKKILFGLGKSNFTKLTLSVCMRALESEKEFSQWLLDVINTYEGDVVNLSEICYPEVQYPIAQLCNDTDLRDIISKQ